MRVTTWDQLTLADPQMLLRPGEVAAIFGVDPKTVSRWAKSGAVAFIWTPGGHRRFRVADVLRGKPSKGKT